MGTTGYPPGRVKVTFRRPPSHAPADDSLNFERRDLITRPTKSTKAHFAQIYQGIPTYPKFGPFWGKILVNLKIRIFYISSRIFYN